jgi:hypothetical protein
LLEFVINRIMELPCASGWQLSLSKAIVLPGCSIHDATGIWGFKVFSFFHHSPDP